jgi:hypothetical protein
VQAGVGAANQTLYQHISKYVAGVRGHLNGLWRRILLWARNIANTAVRTPDMAAGAHWIAHTDIVAAICAPAGMLMPKKVKPGWDGVLQKRVDIGGTPGGAPIVCCRG